MDYEKFKVEIRDLLGLDLQSYKEQQMQRRIRQWITRHKLSGFDDLIEQTKKDPQHKARFLDYLTINTSHFFRDAHVFAAIEETVIPEIAKQPRTKCWSAGCSIGAEVYTLAMLLLKHRTRFRNILATDIDTKIIAKAKEGIYQQSQLSAVPKDLLKKYFTEEDGKFHLDAQVKKNVTFAQHNLLEDTYDKDFDLILCRNVFIYFTPEVQKELTQKFVAALKPKAFFIVGSSEQIMSPSAFGLQRLSYCIYRRT